MYEVIAITVAIVISVFNFVFTYAVAKVVLKHDQIISVLIKNASLLTECYSLLTKCYLSSNATNKEDKK
jgi:hypothetical protein